MSQTRPDGMATDQCTYALVAYDRFLKGQNGLYDMTDAPDSLPGGLPPIELTIPAGEQPVITVPNNQREYVITLQAADRDKDVRIELAEGRTAAVRLQLPAGELPRIEVVQGGVAVVLPQGSEITTGQDQALTLFGPASITAAELTDKLAEGQELESIVRQFALGGESRIAFDSYVTLTYPGLAGYGAAYAEQDELTLIQHFDSQAAGEASGAEVFAYDAAGNLVIQTKHFTDFIVYKLSPEDSSGGGGGGDLGTPPATQSVTVSVDKQTIGKGTVLAPTTVTLQAGDTAWSVLQRTLDARNIPYESRFSGEFASVYVESIAGDGEFDHGEGSGWMYNVNGTYPNIGASAYSVKSGDSIQWRYTTNLGEDLGQAPWPGTDPPGPGTNPGPGGGIPGGGGASEQQALTVPSTLTANYTIKLTEEHKKAKHLTVNVPSSTHAVLLDLAAVTSSIPQLTATRGELTLHIVEGTKLTAGGPAIRLLHTFEPTTEQREAAILAQENEQAKLGHAFTLTQGEQHAAFDQPLSVTIKGGAKQQAAYQAGDEWQQLRVYASQQAAQSAQPGAVYGFVQGQDLVLRTTSATAFITYTVESITAPEPQPEPTDANAIYDDRTSMAAWAYEGIARATDYGWLQGSEGQFRPQASITRAEFTKLLSELLELPLSSSSASAFDDVRAGQWFHPYVQAAYEADLVNGFGSRFEPQATITREQMAVMIARALELPAASGSTNLTDAAQIAAWARSEVAAVYAAGLMTGDANRFHPQQQVSREMAAVVAVRAFDYLEGEPLPPAPEPEPPAPSAALPQVQRTIADAAGYLQRTVTSPAVASVGGEWSVFGLARSQIDVPAAYYDRYLTNLEETLKAADGVLHRVKYTEYDRVILVLTALGKPVDDVAGYNMLQPLADYDTLIKQGINGPIFALIALDSKDYTIPAHTGSGTQTSRQQLVDFILNREIGGGGWALDSQATDPDPDLTAMAIQALTPYYAQQDRVKAAVDRAVAWLSQAQAADGGYLSWGASNAESAAQVVVALTGLGIDPHTDPRFIKNGSSALDALLGFAVAGSGFYHILPGGADNGGAKPGEVDVMATDQALYALVAYERYATGKSRLYDLTDAN
ncbi:S-layer homology domain-containing protein [Paenibacillus sp. 1P07SE]|uniref:S-layer homology domain-containing protein n=1 Tax=Paenibacillus sp. 1P07SE TaxID=3132209 RepID=UPI0039A4ED4D